MIEYAIVAYNIFGSIGFRNGGRNGNVNLAPSAVRHLSKTYDRRVQRKGCPLLSNLDDQLDTRVDQLMAGTSS